METITLDNIYKLMLNFGKLYDIISDEEKKSLITYLIKEIQIYPNGESEQPLKSIEFNFPIYRDGQEVRRLLWGKGNTVDTQAVLAKKLNVSVTTVRSWEQEKSSPSHDALVAICRLYRISADYLLGLSEVDPAYDPRGNQQRFTEDEWAALREYEEFLLWKRRKKAKQ